MSEKRKKSRVELLKTLLIIFLFLLAVLLIGETQVFAQFFGGKTLSSVIASSGSRTVLPLWNEETDPHSAEAAQPIFLAVTVSAGGGHYGVKYSEAELDSVYSSAATQIGEVIGSAGAPVQISEGEWREALASQSIFVDYLHSFPISLISSWFGSEPAVSSSQHSVRRLCISSPDGGSVRLSYIDSGSGLFYSAPTGVLFPSLSHVLQLYQPGSARFAFELGPVYSGCDPYSLILSYTSAPTAAALVPLSSADVDRAVTAFSINPNTASHFTESDGTRVYVESGCSLRISENGILSYRNLSGEGRLRAADGSSSEDLAGMIRYSKKLVESSVGSAGGSMRIYLTDALASGGSYTFSFGCYIAGMPLLRADGLTSYVTVENGVVTSAQILLHTYTLFEQTETVLPEMQTAAMADSGQEALLCYVEAGGSVSARWVLQ
ncbi:MAG: hypothetical protein J5827_04105 [Oscillospiraceae bacterium]|nr:hypothetical protein [Oscillospiraceae bacterium]